MPDLAVGHSRARTTDTSLSQAARTLGISRTTLYQKIKAHGLEVDGSDD